MVKSDLLHQINVALGFTHLPTNEAGVLKEILRLREASGEMDTLRSPGEIEHMTVDSVRRVPNSGPSKICLLWITTKAQVIEQSSQMQGQPVRHDILELPQRMLNLFFDEEQARQAHRILDEQVQIWDVEG